eukprot:10631701-Alexandrium_andersonii.AAC.1
MLARPSSSTRESAVPLPVVVAGHCHAQVLNAHRAERELGERARQQQLGLLSEFFSMLRPLVLGLAVAICGGRVRMRLGR